MTDKDIEELANKIADIIFKRQEEYDAQFQIDMGKLAEESIVYTIYNFKYKRCIIRVEGRTKKLH
jgi:hypothetical protein